MKLDTDVLPLNINISFQDFVNIYRLAVTTKESTAYEKLYNAMQYCFSYWVTAWETSKYYLDINIYTLIRLLKADNKPAACIDWKLNTYKSFLTFNSLTILDELNYCLVQHVNKVRTIYREYFRPKNLLFFIAKDIKMFLFKKIRSILSAHIRNNNFLIPISSKKSYYDFHIDYTYLENYPLHNNVLLLILDNLKSEDIRSLLNLSRDTYKEIYTCLLQNLKQLNK